MVEIHIIIDPTLTRILFTQMARSNVLLYNFQTHLVITGFNIWEIVLMWITHDVSGASALWYR